MADEQEFAVLPNGEAHRLHTDPYLNEILDGMEHEALERCVAANPSDHETRQISAMEVRAIRSLRAKLKTFAEGKTKRPARGSVA
ncbi:hypothetical protein [Tateyamaria sp.]|uniref:hypothetical protein n=1 Tax=Tateyamaria sp. TaxID=1929288 RepID=UPI003B2232D1